MFRSCEVLECYVWEAGARSWSYLDTMRLQKSGQCCFHIQRSRKRTRPPSIAGTCPEDEETLTQCPWTGFEGKPQTSYVEFPCEKTTVCVELNTRGTSTPLTRVVSRRPGGQFCLWLALQGDVSWCLRSLHGQAETHQILFYPPWAFHATASSSAFRRTCAPGPVAPWLHLPALQTNYIQEGLEGKTPRETRACSTLSRDMALRAFSPGIKDRQPRTHTNPSQPFRFPMLWLCSICATIIFTAPLHSDHGFHPLPAKLQIYDRTGPFPQAQIMTVPFNLVGGLSPFPAEGFGTSSGIGTVFQNPAELALVVCGSLDGALAVIDVSVNRVLSRWAP
eukprot:284819115_6